MQKKSLKHFPTRLVRPSWSPRKQFEHAFVDDYIVVMQMYVCNDVAGGKQEEYREVYRIKL